MAVRAGPDLAPWHIIGRREGTGLTREGGGCGVMDGHPVTQLKLSRSFGQALGGEVGGTGHPMTAVAHRSGAGYGAGGAVARWRRTH